MNGLKSRPRWVPLKIICRQSDFLVCIRRSYSESGYNHIFAPILGDKTPPQFIGPLRFTDACNVGRGLWVGPLVDCDFDPRYAIMCDLRRLYLFHVVDADRRCVIFATSDEGECQKYDRVEFHILYLQNIRIRRLDLVNTSKRPFLPFGGRSWLDPTTTRTMYRSGGAVRKLEIRQNRFANSFGIFPNQPTCHSRYDGKDINARMPEPGDSFSFLLPFLTISSA